ncbi:MAG: patatin-like phospholipase family protein [Pseudomonadales bacterium]|nr:patatin-like phospholipase family protein [Pseudomonadales bacterium]
MTDFPLTILAGSEARQQLAGYGWAPERFDALTGASGGAKLLALTHLDRFLFGDYLQRSQHPVELYGSSIGSWRHAALAAPDPLYAITQLQERYFSQAWDEQDPRSPTEIVDELCDWVLEGFLTPEVIHHIVNNSRFRTHIVTARGKGINSRRGLLLGLGMGGAALGNLLNRGLLQTGFQRVVFSTGCGEAFRFRDFDTTHIELNEARLKPALVASGSIPFLMSGVQGIDGAPAGHYWDGGIIDYHFDFRNHAGSGLVLYPHFGDEVVKGWFDKSLRWRRNDAAHMKRVVLLAPSREYIARLPYGKIPDRKDFSKMKSAERLLFWQTAMDQSRHLAEAFEAVISDPDPLARVQPF